MCMSCLFCVCVCQYIPSWMEPSFNMINASMKKRRPCSSLSFPELQRMYAHLSLFLFLSYSHRHTQTHTCTTATLFEHLSRPTTGACMHACMRVCVCVCLSVCVCEKCTRTTTAYQAHWESHGIEFQQQCLQSHCDIELQTLNSVHCISYEVTQAMVVFHRPKLLLLLSFGFSCRPQRRWLPRNKT